MKIPERAKRAPLNRAYLLQGFERKGGACAGSQIDLQSIGKCVVIIKYRRALSLGNASM